MDSIIPKCTVKKHDYDKCFNEWFSEKFLKGETTKLPKNCEDLYQKYQDCIKDKIKNELKIED